MTWSYRAWYALFLVALSAVFLPATAQINLKSASSVVTTPQVRAELLAFAPDGVGVGKKVWLGLQIAHQPQWHTYWKNSGDSGQPTDMQWTLPAGVQTGETRWPVPKKIWIGSLANYGYENTVLLPVPLEISTLFKPDFLKPDLEIKLKAVWLVCKQECIPEEGEFTLKIPVQGSTALQREAFEAAFAAYPKEVQAQAVAKIAGCMAKRWRCFLRRQRCWRTGRSSIHQVVRVGRRLGRVTYGRRCFPFQPSAALALSRCRWCSLPMAKPRIA
jgi:DsbC/DsbD-like thiol-disulfide interchange protein